MEKITTNKQKKLENKKIAQVLKTLGREDKIKAKDFSVDINDIFNFINEKKILSYDQFIPLKEVLLENGTAEEIFKFIYITHAICAKDLTELIAKLCEKENLFYLNQLISFAKKSKEGSFNEYNNRITLLETDKCLLTRTLEKLNEKALQFDCAHRESF